MSTHKYFDKICCVILVFTLILTVLLMNVMALGVQKSSTAKGYENRLFNNSNVHTINIVMDDWDEFIAGCTDEEYVPCAVVIDNEAYKNVGIRAKGNTSLSNVKNYGNNRYSFKIEFDHYDSTKSYYGLDKLSLNNIIQDNTYMKDFLCYQMMGYFGVSAPLCSYVQILVNGEEWGLYLAVEGVEEAFLERNFGRSYGELYKPDSLSMGGGRGNGGDFNMDDWNSELTEEQKTQLINMMEALNDEQMTQLLEKVGYDSADSLKEAINNAESVDDVLNGADINSLFSELGGSTIMKPSPDENTGMPFGGDMNGMSRPDKADGEPNQNEYKPDMPEGMEGGFDANMPFNNGDTDNNMSGNPQSIPHDRSDFGGKGDFGGSMGNNDVKLIYSDDSYESYSDIFDNAKTDISNADKDRLIASLKSLNENSDIEDVVNVNDVIRYFVVHNFVCNFDSYTGSMIHNYYLYENDGQLSMIPWDYNLAFGSFVGGSDATSMVNYPIDSPVSGGTVDSRPMIAWIFENEEYTEMYHQYFSEFISEYFGSGYFSDFIDEISSMISPYVESDPTKFCTFEDFEKGADTLKEFCLLRAESVSGQLEGTIPSTSDGQSQDNSALIDASYLTISDMGNMNNKDGGMNQFKVGEDNKDMQKPTATQDDFQESSDVELPSQNGGEQASFGTSDNSAGENPMISADLPQNGNEPFGGGMQSSSQSGEALPEIPKDGSAPAKPGDGEGSFDEIGADRKSFHDEKAPQSTNSKNTESVSWILLGISGIVLIFGIAIAFAYKKKG